MLIEKDNFWEIQYWIASTAIRMKRAYFGADMGFGKTASCLKAIDWLMLEGSLEGKVLVIAPYYVARDTWPDEIENWDFTKRMTYSLIMGDPEEREDALLGSGREALIHIVNFENFMWLYRKWTRRKRWPYQVLILDEATRIGAGKQRTAKTKRKDGTTTGNRMSMFGALCKLITNFEYIILLSGTPGARGCLRFWAPIFLLDRGKRLGPTKDIFEQRYVTKNHYTHQTEPKDGAEHIIVDKIKDICFILKPEDYGIEMPEILPPINRFCHLSPAMMKKYRKFEKESYLEEENIDAVNPAVLAGKLLQFANGHVYDEDKQPHRIHLEKFKLLDQVLLDMNGKNVLCAYPFKFDAIELRRRYPNARFWGESRHDKKDWNEGRIELLFAHPAQIAHGNNLQFGGRIAMWFGLTWDLELYLQFCKRLARPGSRFKTVRPVRLLTKGTYDALQGIRLAEKGTTQDRIDDGLRRQWKDLRGLA